MWRACGALGYVKVLLPEGHRLEGFQRCGRHLCCRPLANAADGMATPAQEAYQQFYDFWVVSRYTTPSKPLGTAD